MENLITKTLVLISRIIVIGFFTLAYVTPLYILFYLIIFKNLELLNEISIKYYSISYLIGFTINYVVAVNSLKKDEKQVNKGF
jgi:hypothetical protein